MPSKRPDVAKRMKDVCEALFEGKPTKFAAALKISYPNLSQYFQGKSLPGNKMQARFRTLGIDPEWILYGTGRSPLEPVGHVRESVDYTTVREDSFAVYDAVPAARESSSHFSHLTHPSIAADFPPHLYFFVKLTKETAESTKPVLRPGDLVLIARKNEATDGDLVAARWDTGPGAVKIFRDVDGKAGLWSINPAIEPLILPREAVQLHRVVLIKKKHA
jgi:hypothetical protein